MAKYGKNGGAKCAKYIGVDMNLILNFLHGTRARAILKISVCCVGHSGTGNSLTYCGLLHWPLGHGHCSWCRFSGEVPTRMVLILLEYN